MCRWAAYRGQPLYLEDIISSPAHSLVEQSHHATEAKTNVNGDGFGVAWYGERDEPGRFRDILPAWSDCNLKSLVRQIRSPLFLAHVRASTGGGTSRDNCHPFVFGRWSFMHNGQISGFGKLRRAMEASLDERYYAARRGTNDSELLFLMALNNGLDDQPVAAIEKTLKSIEELARQHGFETVIRFTASFSDGETLYAIRYATDKAAPTLYYAPIGVDGMCLVSEPLNDDRETWICIPDGSAVEVSREGIYLEPFGHWNEAETRLHSVSK